MNSDDFKYLGFLNQDYSFVDKNGKKVNFSKCRKELIELFKLRDNENINEWFRITYFIVHPKNFLDDIDGVYIVSDMEIIKK